MGLTIHISDAYNAFLLLAFLFICSWLRWRCLWWRVWRWRLWVRVHLSSCLSSCFELSVDHVSGLWCKVVIKSVCRVSGIFSVSRQFFSLISSLEFSIWLQYAVISLIVSKPCLYPSLDGLKLSFCVPLKLFALVEGGNWDCVYPLHWRQGARGFWTLDFHWG